MFDELHQKCVLLACAVTYMWLCALNPGLPRGLERPRANMEFGAHNIDCGKRSRDPAPRKFYMF